MIYAVQNDKHTGDISFESGSEIFDYSAEYMIITDNTDTPADIYNTISDTNSTWYHKAPIKGDDFYGVDISNISISRRDDANAKAVPSYNLPVKRDGSYAIWTYSVKYSGKSSTTGGTDQREKAPWEIDEVQNCSLSTRDYEWYSNICYNGVPATGETYTKNAVGDTLYRNRVLRNGVLSFDYSVKQFNASYIKQGICTLNSKDITVAGIPIPAYFGLITGLNVSRQEYKEKNKNNPTEYFTVHVDIEIAYEKTLKYTPMLGTGYRARLKKDGEILPIHEFISSDAALKSKIPDRYWFDKDRNLGSFAGMSNPTLVYGTDYERITEAKILDKDGCLYKPESGNAPVIDMDDPDIDIVKCYEYKVKDWSGFNFPTKGLFFK